LARRLTSQHRWWLLAISSMGFEKHEWSMARTLWSTCSWWISSAPGWTSPLTDVPASPLLVPPLAAIGCRRNSVSPTSTSSCDCKAFRQTAFNLVKLPDAKSATWLEMEFRQMSRATSGQRSSRQRAFDRHHLMAPKGKRWGCWCEWPPGADVDLISWGFFGTTLMCDGSLGQTLRMLITTSSWRAMVRWGFDSCVHLSEWGWFRWCSIFTLYNHLVFTFLKNNVCSSDGVRFSLSTTILCSPFWKIMFALYVLLTTWCLTRMVHLGFLTSSDFKKTKR